MNQNEFFNILMNGLKDFPEAKLQDIISYYERKFTNGLISGSTEAEIIKDLGNPDLIVEKYRNKKSNTPINSELLTIDVNTISNITTEPFFEHKNTTVNDKFYDLHESNPSPDIKENNYKYDSSNEDTCNFNRENDFSSNIKNSNYANENTNKKTTQYNVNNFLRFCIVGLTLIIFFPVITGIIGFIFGLFGISISILIGSIGLLVGGTFTSFAGLPNIPAFVSNFPYPVIVLFSLGSISLSIFLTILFYYLCKFFIKISIKAYKSLKSKGGAF